ncbi:IST1 homolog [Impatiens glandulifera]|uniref:IST1 homolog n=1 Tax=Impatiens glandulifera TaxID=253017 RepID=UPI001FB0CE5C|nr:IST1 homolog [Impatiens glandulifera]
MSMLDSFFNKGFRAAKCKTLLKLSIPRIKLLRNRREIQIKQMRKDIAKLLETGQEATARIRVEHIIREEKMMAAQEIVELFCELISVRLPIIEAQRECPLDLKEAISSVCFAAPRCADLPELQQVQMMFVSKYGKEFVAAATELMPECGVNRQIIELLSIRAPEPDVKLKLLKEIAEEYEVEWDPAASETEFLKPHEDLLNGPTQFVSGSKLPLPKEKHDETVFSTIEKAPSKNFDLEDVGFDELCFPEVPKASIVRPTVGKPSVPEMLPFPQAPFLDADQLDSPSEKMKSETNVVEDKQFLPFMSPPSLSSSSFPTKPTESDHPPPPTTTTKTTTTISKTKSRIAETAIDLQDVLAAAQAAADSAERAAAAARSAASLAQVRISELVKRRDDDDEDDEENPFHVNSSPSGETDNNDKKKPYLDHENSLGSSSTVSDSSSPHLYNENNKLLGRNDSSLPSFDDPNPREEFSSLDNIAPFHHHQQPQRVNSIDEEQFSYPNLFVSPGPNVHNHH